MKKKDVPDNVHSPVVDLAPLVHSYLDARPGPGHVTSAYVHVDLGGEEGAVLVQQFSSGDIQSAISVLC